MYNAFLLPEKHITKELIKKNTSSKSDEQ